MISLLQQAAVVRLSQVHQFKGLVDEVRENPVSFSYNFFAIFNSLNFVYTCICVNKRVDFSHLYYFPCN